MRAIVLVLMMLVSLHADRDGGPYVGLGLGSSVLHDGGYYDDVKKSTSSALSYYGGAYINKYFSVELGYNSFNLKGHTNGYDVIKDNQESFTSFTILTISTLAHYAILDDSLDFYARFGAGDISKSDVGSSGSTMVYGVGTSYRFTKNFSLKLAYDKFDFGLDTTGNGASNHKMSLDYFYTAFEVQF